MIKIGDGVKVYLPPNYGRQDAVVVRILNERRRIINAKIIRSGKIAPSLIYSADLGNDLKAYWTELPPGYVPGSQGH